MGYSVRRGVLGYSVRRGVLRYSVRRGVLGYSVRRGVLRSSVRRGVLRSRKRHRVHLVTRRRAPLDLVSFPRSPRGRDRGRRQRPQHARGDARFGRDSPQLLGAHPEVAAAHVHVVHALARQLHGLDVRVAGRSNRDVHVARRGRIQQKAAKIGIARALRLGATGEGLLAEDEVRVLEGARVRSRLDAEERVRVAREIYESPTVETRRRLGTASRTFDPRTPSWGCRRFRLRRSTRRRDTQSPRRTPSCCRRRNARLPRRPDGNRRRNSRSWSVTRCPGRNAGNRVRRPATRRAPRHPIGIPRK